MCASPVLHARCSAGSKCFVPSVSGMLESLVDQLAPAVAQGNAGDSKVWGGAVTLQATLHPAMARHRM